MAMFTKLIAIRSVASKRLGFSRSVYTSFDLLLSDSFNLKNCAGVMAKKAVSVPETNPEINNKTINTISSNTKPTEKANSGFIIEAETFKIGEKRELSGSKFRDK